MAAPLSIPVFESRLGRRVGAFAIMVSDSRN